MKKSLAFTLAEVLITLAIIGVIAAITIPALITNYQKEITIERLKTTYSILHQALRLSISDSGDFEAWDYSGTSSAKVFNKYILPHLNATTKYINGKTLTYYESSGKKESGLAVLRDRIELVTLNNGVQLLLNDGSIVGKGANDGVSLGFMIDVDGYNSGLNKFGHDAFYGSIVSNLGLILMYSDDGEHGQIKRTREQLKNGPSSYSYQCNKKGRGMWCGELIRQDNWEIKSDYPW